MPTKTFATVFGAVLAIILLALYVGTVFAMIAAVADCEKTNQNADRAAKAVLIDECVAGKVTQGMEYVVTTVAGLVSALVVSQLAVAQPGESPMARLVPQDASRFLKIAGNVVPVLYLSVWGLTGLCSLIVGVMIYTDAYKTLADLGTTWLGLAVAAGYAYFGIQPQGNPPG